MNLIALFVTWIFVILVDIPWLLWRQEYHSQFFAKVQGAPLQLRYGPAAAVYILFAIALLWFAPAPSWQEAAKRGAAVGAIMYGFYDATNWATLRGWTAEMAIVDTLWGATAGAITSVLLFHSKKLIPGL